MKTSGQFFAEAETIMNRSEIEGREPTDAEVEEVRNLIAEGKALKQRDNISIHGVTGSTVTEFTQGTTSTGGGPGDQFVASEGYKAIRDPLRRSANWSTGAVEIETKGTLTTNPGTALVPAGYVPGIVPTLFQTLYVSDLMPNRPAVGNPVRYVAESTATNAAAAVAEGGLKPESTLQFSETSEPVRKIATYLPVSDEMLEDAPQIQAYLNERLSLFVRIQEEAQLLLGNGTAPNLAGLISPGNRTIGTFTRNAGTSNELAILKAANGSRGSSFLNPDWVVIHPNNWLPIRAGTDSTGQYFGGGPFLGAYGNTAQASSSQFASDNLWGMRVLVTSNITPGTALIGSSQGAAIYRKGALRVEASNSHSTYFQSNLIALRAEERLALAVFRPSAFTAVVGLST